jgi:hypothetical protein
MKLSWKARGPDWKKAPFALKWITGLVGWIYAISFIAMVVVEFRAFDQPSHQTAEYTRPMQVKSVVRYVTPMQERIDVLAHWGAFGGLVALAACVASARWIEHRREKFSQNR